MNDPRPSTSSNQNSDEETTVLNPEEFEVLDIDDNPETNEEGEENEEFTEASEMYIDDEEESNFEEREEVDYMAVTEDDCEIKEASLLYEGHSDSVLCCSVSNCGSLIATGSLDDSGHIFNPYTGAALHKCTGHSESVEFACLSHDSLYVATGDLDGLVQVWKIRDGESCFSFHTGSEMRWLEWHKSSHILFCGTESGEVWVWLVPKGITKTLPNPGTSVESGCCTPDGKRVVVGYNNGTVRVIDVKTETAVKVDPSSNFDGSVIAVACHADNVIAIAGSLDGDVKLFNTVTGKVLKSMNTEQFNPRSMQQKYSIEAVGFCSSVLHLALFADIQGTIVIFDTNNQVARHVVTQPAGVTRFCFPPSSPHVFVGSTDGVIRQYDVLAGKLVYKFVGHQSEIMSLSTDGSGSILASSSNDKIVRIYNVSSNSQS